MCVCVCVGWGGFSPLHFASLHGNRAMVDMLLSNGADPNLTCDAGMTAFHFACRSVTLIGLGKPHYPLLLNLWKGTRGRALGPCRAVTGMEFWVKVIG